MSLPTLHVQVLTPILKSEGIFVQNVSTFKELLNTPPDYWQPRINNFRATTTTFSELVSDLLTEWSERIGSRATLRELLGILNQMKLRALAEKLKQKLHNVDLNTQISGIFEIPAGAVGLCASSARIKPFKVDPSIRRYFGRQQEIEELKQFFLHRNQQFAWNIVAVLGLGGIGKTQLVKKFLEDDVVSDANISWFSAESPEDLRRSIYDFAESIDMKTEFMDASELVRQVGLKIGSERTWLVVLDNVDNDYELVRAVGKVLHSLSNTFVIVTTRLRKIFAQFCAVLDVKDLDPENGVDLLKANLGFHIPAEEGHELCRILQNHPLALNQASAFIKETRTCYDSSYGIKEYIIEFQKRSKELLNVSLDFDPYQATTLVTWDISIKAIDKNTVDKELSWQAIKLLDILSFMYPENIQLDDLQKLYGFVVPPTFPKFSNRSIQLLKLYSLVSDDDNHYWSIHRLVQEVIRIKLKDETDRKLQGSLACSTYTEMLGQLIQGYLNIECFKAKEVLHLMRIWQFAVNDTPKKHTANTVVPEIIFLKLSELQMHREAHEFSISYHKHMFFVFGDFHRATTDAEWRRITSLLPLEKHDQAAMELERVIEKTKQKYEEVDCIVLLLTISLVDILNERKQFPASSKLLKETLRVCKGSLGINHAYTKLFAWKIGEIMLLALGTKESSTKLLEDLQHHQNILGDTWVGFGYKVNNVNTDHPAYSTLSLEHTTKTEMEIIGVRCPKAVIEVTLAYIEARKLVLEGKESNAFEVLHDAISKHHEGLQEGSPVLIGCTRLRDKIASFLRLEYVP